MKSIKVLAALVLACSVAGCSGGGSAPTALPLLPTKIHQATDNGTVPAAGTTITFPSYSLLTTNTVSVANGITSILALSLGSAAVFVPEGVAPKVVSSSCAGVADVDTIKFSGNGVSVIMVGVGTCSFTLTAPGYAPTVINVTVPR